MAQECISQVSEDIEGRVTKKLSKEFSRTESRILGALCKLDEFRLNPQVLTCSVGVPGTSRNNNSENRRPTGDCSLGDPCPEVMFSACHCSNLNDSEQEETHHNVAGKFCETLPSRPSRFPKFTMLFENSSLHVLMQHIKSLSKLNP